MLVAQPKLVVGASFDPLEVEADRVAADVVRAMAAQPAPTRDGHGCGPACAVRGSVPLVHRAARRRAHTDGDPIGAAGGDVHAADEAALRQARGGGVSLPADFQARVEPAMGADLSGVRVHTGSVATELNRSFGAERVHRRARHLLPRRHARRRAQRARTWSRTS